MANKEKQWTARIDAREKMMTLFLEEQNRWQEEQNSQQEQQLAQLIAALAQSQHVGTTQPNRNPMTNVNQTTAVDTVPLLRRHSELSPQSRPRLNRKKKTKRKKRITNSTAFVPSLPTIPECDSKNVYDDGMKTNESAAVTKFEYSTVIPPNGTPNETADIPTVAPMNTVDYDPEPVFDDDHNADDDVERDNNYYNKVGEEEIIFDYSDTNDNKYFDNHDGKSSDDEFSDDDDDDYNETADDKSPSDKTNFDEDARQKSIEENE